ncbi:MAG: ATP-binding protein [Novosphingobium sp.]
MQAPSLPSRLALPLGLQLLAILVSSLIVAQLVTLVLTVALPPEPAQRWNLDDVAASLAGRASTSRLERRRMAGPPDISGSGWLVSASSREALAKKLGKPTGDVVLAFYTQLPVGGMTVPVGNPRPAQSAADAPALSSGWVIETAQAQAVPGGPPPGGAPGGAFPGGGFPGGGFPGGGTPGGARMPGGSMPSSRSPAPPTSSPHQPSAPAANAPAGAPGAAVGNAGAPPPGSGPALANSPGTPPPSAMPPQAAPLSNPVPPPLSGPVAASPTRPRQVSAPPARPDNGPGAASAERSAVAPAAAPLETRGVSAQAPLPAAAAEAPALRREGQAAILPAGTPQPIPFRQSTGVLALGSSPFIEGDFIAAARQGDGNWIAVAPQAEPFPNRWQRRVMLWFALSLVIVAPLAWLFARRIVKPLERFAQTAEVLGRDPAATVLPLSGPAEIGRAARAFNIMHTRLRAFVDDRTAMIGAISHDLRTPLTRLRFRLEDVPDDQREALLREVEEMEQMISQVIGFIRDASTPGPRERIDFAELVEGTVADAKVLGGRVELQGIEHGIVEVDPLGMRRLLGNLLENALKYGESARVRVALRDQQVVAEVIDDGPGIPAEERDQAFDPFYRGVQVRDSGKPGSGLGLAVCRSIARAHGGDVQLEQRSEGFVARVTVPLSFAERPRKAA